MTKNKNNFDHATVSENPEYAVTKFLEWLMQYRADAIVNMSNSEGEWDASVAQTADEIYKKAKQALLIKSVVKKELQYDDLIAELKELVGEIAFRKLASRECYLYSWHRAYLSNWYVSENPLSSVTLWNSAESTDRKLPQLSLFDTVYISKAKILGTNQSESATYRLSEKVVNYIKENGL